MFEKKIEAKNFLALNKAFIKFNAFEYFNE